MPNLSIRILALLVAGLRLAAQPLIVAGPSDVGFSGTADSFVFSTSLASTGSVIQFTISGSVAGSAANLPIALTQISATVAGKSVPDFLVVSPPTATTPATLHVGLNPNIVRTMSPGRYDLDVTFSVVGTSPASSTGLHVGLFLSAPAPPTVGSVVSTASYQPNISPGEMVSIFGARLGQSNTSGQYSDSGFFPTTLGGTTVTFNGISAPLLYVDTGQINAVVPYGVAGQKTVDVVVTHYSQPSVALTVPVVDTSPAIFTATQNGTGQGAILNFQAYPAYTYNSIDNPAAKGSLIELFATGIGVWNPSVPDGSISLTANNFTNQPVSLMIGGQPARILYAGAAGYQVFSLLQITAYVPDGISSGTQPVVLKIGQSDNSHQAVTMAVQ